MFAMVRLQQFLVSRSPQQCPDAAAPQMDPQEQETAKAPITTELSSLPIRLATENQSTKAETLKGSAKSALVAPVPSDSRTPASEHGVTRSLPELLPAARITRSMAKEQSTNQPYADVLKGSKKDPTTPGNEGSPGSSDVPSTDDSAITPESLQAFQFDSKKPKHDEERVNMALITFLQAISMVRSTSTTALWFPDRRIFQVTLNGNKIYEARVDGILTRYHNEDVLAIVEVKRAPRTDAVRMQESAQMAAWICQHPASDEQLAKARKSGEKFR